MSSPGVSPLAIIAPDLYAKQIAIQRRQALAQSLLQSGESNPGSAAYGGLANAGKTLLGAFLAKRGDQDLVNLYAPQPDASQAAPQASPQVSNAGGSVPAPDTGTPPLSAQSGPTPQISNAPSPNVALGQALQGNTPQPQAPQPAARTIPNAMGGAIPDLPGLTHQQSMLAYFQSPQAYFTALAAAKGPTPDIKNAEYAAGGNHDLAQQMVFGSQMKAASDNLRPGGGSLNYATGQIFTMPNTNGIQTTFPQGANGPAQMSMAPGAAAALQQSGQASGLGAAAAKPAIGYGANNMPVATNQAVMATGGIPQGPISGQPQSPSPNFSVQNPASFIQGVIGSPVTVTSGFRTPQHNSEVGGVPTSAHMQQGGAYDFVPQGMSTADAAARLRSSGLPFSKIIDEGTHVHVALAQNVSPQSTSAQSGALLPELPQGQATYMQGQAKDAADRHDAVVAAAAESPMRINVLDNIIRLSQSGVGTGPGAEFQNNIKGYLANTPGLGKLLGGTQANVGNFQELQKFMYQNALRNWQAAGGTGTDSQLESAAKANPNDHLFPQALQTIAKWGKASELAVQGKANAQDAYLSQNGNTPTNQIKFESSWRNAFDPKVFQYSLMSPQEKQTFAKQDLKTPQAAKAFIAKQQALKQLGALQ